MYIYIYIHFLTLVNECPKLSCHTQPFNSHFRNAPWPLCSFLAGGLIGRTPRCQCRRQKALHFSAPPGGLRYPLGAPKGGQSGARGSLLVRGAARKWRNFEENHGNDGHEVHFLQKTMEMIEIPGRDSELWVKLGSTKIAEKWRWIPTFKHGVYSFWSTPKYDLAAETYGISGIHMVTDLVVYPMVWLVVSRVSRVNLPFRGVKSPPISGKRN